MSKHLTHFLSALVKLTDKELDYISNHFESKTFDKKAKLLTVGSIAKELYYIEKGCLRIYCEREGTEVTTHFYTENMFVPAFGSFVFQEPSLHGVEALERCEVLALSYNDLQKIYSEIPKTNELARKFLEIQYVRLNQRFISHILQTSEERYWQLLEDQPSLVNRIPQHLLATYLGVTPVTLSRIRNRFKKK